MNQENEKEKKLAKEKKKSRANGADGTTVFKGHNASQPMSDEDQGDAADEYDEDAADEYDEDAADEYDEDAADEYDEDAADEYDKDQGAVGESDAPTRPSTPQPKKRRLTVEQYNDDDDEDEEDEGNPYDSLIPALTNVLQDLHTHLLIARQDRAALAKVRKRSNTKAKEVLNRTSKNANALYGALPGMATQLRKLLTEIMRVLDRSIAAREREANGKFATKKY